MKRIISTLMILMGTSLTAVAATDVVGEKTVDLKGGGQALITTRKGGDKLGRPYTMELRVNCQGGRMAWHELPVLDQESVCDVKPQSAKLSQDGKSIVVLIRETDADDFNRLSKQTPAGILGEIQPQCKKEAAEFKFPVESYCLR
ncbi:hypothetical protein Bb109J_c3383 [Bdellovibrio bacteriovorus]|uniref:hypothetical protein n=1 Tax=Bdellovibrio bacteriovorus TaxID=959 RepID=UPI00045BF7FB|nr:hypothetical protein [Bdellovibrio bacteriovorus]AHZ85417.1 hypothetical protein EP01_10775 [Bdellovibrio bacteriovorus]BEV69963.1 hypothetical protein Bb109J_c3383 [Bdellovibrio bacteriovorus]